MSKEEIQAMIWMLLQAGFSTTTSAGAGLNVMQDLFSTLGDPEIGALTGTYLPQYTMPQEFDESQYLTATSRALTGNNLALREAATGLLYEGWSGLDAVEHLTQALEGNLNISPQDISNQVNAMVAEIGERDRARDTFNREQLKEMESNVYGKAGLPQPWEEFGFDYDVLGRPQTPPPKSEATSRAEDTAAMYAKQLEDSGVLKSLAGKDEALVLRLGALMNEAAKGQGPQKTPEGDPLYEATANYVLPGSLNQYGVPSPRGGVKISFAPAKTPQQKSSKVDMTKAAKNLSAVPALMKVFLGASQALPEFKQAKSDVDKRYATQDALRIQKEAKIAEQERLAAFFREMDLDRTQRLGITPLGEAIKERGTTTVDPIAAMMRYLGFNR